jgi:hypothetical protein
VCEALRRCRRCCCCGLCCRCHVLRRMRVAERCCCCGRPAPSLAHSHFACVARCTARLLRAWRAAQRRRVAALLVVCPAYRLTEGNGGPTLKHFGCARCHSARPLSSLPCFSRSAAPSLARNQASRAPRAWRSRRPWTRAPRLPPLRRRPRRRWRCRWACRSRRSSRRASTALLLWTARVAMCGCPTPCATCCTRTRRRCWGAWALRARARKGRGGMTAGAKPLFAMRLPLGARRRSCRARRAAAPQAARPRATPHALTHRSRRAGLCVFAPNAQARVH